VFDSGIPGQKLHYPRWCTINYTIREILNDNLKDVNYCQLRGCYFSLLKKSLTAEFLVKNYITHDAVESKKSNTLQNSSLAH